MREIKYRQPIDFGSGFAGWHYWGWLGIGYFVGPLGQNMSKHQGYQYTGLKDKNGVEIYEGDIVYYQFTDKDAPVNHVCTFAEDIARFGFKDSDAIWGVNQKDVSARAEVIGNVHENPELIER